MWFLSYLVVNWDPAFQEASYLAAVGAQAGLAAFQEDLAFQVQGAAAFQAAQEDLAFQADLLVDQEVSVHAFDHQDSTQRQEEVHEGLRDPRDRDLSYQANLDHLVDQDLLDAFLA